MANPWFRLWTDMVNDPKWRTIARVSKQKIGDVISVYLHMMTCASNATERGRTEGWCDEDVATALDIETEQVTAIRNAMQGRVLDGNYLTGWEKRQPLREDGAAERAKAWREAKKIDKEQEKEADKTQPNATERNRTLDKIREEEIREEYKKPTTSNEVVVKKVAKASRLPEDWLPEKKDIEFCEAERPDLKPNDVFHRFRDYWLAKAGKDACKVDWSATWRNWVRNEKTIAQPRASPIIAKQAKFDPTAYVNRNRINSQNDIIDI